MDQPLYKRILTKPPMLFPWVALFHITMLGFIVWLYRDVPVMSLAWLQPLWLLCYTICWLAICDLRRWGAYGYLALTSINLILYATVSNAMLKELYTSPLFLIDVVFCLFILFYFRRME